MSSYASTKDIQAPGEAFRIPNPDPVTIWFRMQSGSETVAVSVCVSRESFALYQSFLLEVGRCQVLLTNGKRALVAGEISYALLTNRKEGRIDRTQDQQLDSPISNLPQKFYKKF